MNHKQSTQVLIVGAGPVGLTLAMDLAIRGVQVLIAETRSAGEAPSVKCNHVSARTMEIFRRLGVAPDVRNAGLPEEYPNDVSYRTTFVGQELSRIPIPARKFRYTSTSGPDTWWPTPEPPHRINQIFLEPILFAHAAAMSNITILNRVRIDDFSQDETCIRASGTSLEDGRTLEFDASYLVGCDGGKSIIRKKIGAKLSGTDIVGRVQSTYFRAPDLINLQKHDPAWATFSLNPRRSGNVYAIDGKETWLLHNYLKPSETDFEAIDRDWAIREILGVDSSFQYEILSKEDWFARRLVADKFRDRRAFICGDASHLWVPMAGYGMNAGIADAMNLSWQLAAVLNGWGHSGILRGYETERLPITEQVSFFAMNHAYALQAKRESVPGDLESDTQEGQAAREKAGRELYELNVQQYCCAGLNFGYYYDKSPLISYDGEGNPAYTMNQFISSTVPGCRTPHFWLPRNDGRESIYDVCGHDFALLRFDPSINVQPITEAAKTRSVPLKVIDVPPGVAGPEYNQKLVLSRPDQHVAWRGNAAPSDSSALIDLVRGAVH